MFIPEIPLAESCEVKVVGVDALNIIISLSDVHNLKEMRLRSKSLIAYYHNIIHIGCSSCEAIWLGLIWLRYS